MKKELVRRHIKKLAELEVRYLNHQLEVINSNGGIPISERAVTSTHIREQLMISQFIYEHADLLEIPQPEQIKS